MSAKNHAKKVAAEDPPLEQPEDHPDNVPKVDSLADYRDAIALFAASREKVQTLQGVQTDLAGQLARAEVDREAALNRASQTDELESEEAEALVRLATRTEILRRKQSDVANRLETAEAELAELGSAVACRFSALWHAFFQHAIGQAKDSLQSQLIPGVAPHIVELVSRHFKSVQPIRALDIRTTDVQTVLESAGRLLERVSSTEGFIAPPYVPATPTAPELDPLWVPGVPWGDRGVDVDAEIRAMHASDPSLTLPRAMRLLYERFPQIFAPPKEGTLSLNERLEFKVPMIGSTTVVEPVAERFSHV